MLVCLVNSVRWLCVVCGKVCYYYYSRSLFYWIQFLTDHWISEDDAVKIKSAFKYKNQFSILYTKKRTWYVWTCLYIMCVCVCVCVCIYLINFDIFHDIPLSIYIYILIKPFSFIKIASNTTIRIFQINYCYYYFYFLLLLLFVEFQ